MRTQKFKEKRQAIELMKQGKNNKEISQKIGVTEKTVGKWLRPLRKNLNVCNTPQSLLVRRLNMMLLNENLDFEKINNLVNLIKKVKDLNIS